MLKVVMDTNVFVSSFFGGIPGKIINLWKNGRVLLCLSQPIVDEYVEVLRRLGLKEPGSIEDLIRLFAEGRHCVFAGITPDIHVVRDDPDDDKFIECAVALNCRIIISGDNHLKSIRKYFDIDLLSPREFIDRLRAGGFSDFST